MNQNNNFYYIIKTLTKTQVKIINIKPINLFFFFYFFLVK